MNINQVTSGDDGPNPSGLPSQELLLPQLLKPAGYVCGLIGKWHLGIHKPDANAAGVR